MNITSFEALAKSAFGPKLSSIKTCIIQYLQMAFKAIINYLPCLALFNFFFSFLLAFLTRAIDSSSFRPLAFEKVCAFLP
jgi:hypothetical protein